jgi:hypothetical protein
MKQMMTLAMLLLGLQAQALVKNCELYDSNGRQQGELKFFAPDTMPVEHRVFPLKCQNSAGSVSHTAFGTHASIHTTVHGRDVFLELGESAKVVERCGEKSQFATMRADNEFGFMSLDLNMTWNQFNVVHALFGLDPKHFTLKVIGLKDVLQLDVKNCIAKL